ncbi:hypothetical protein BD311DRAFT_763359 [Dichomitus squalens]|uniref:Uncharacterized protein n=1 Tax=Dichomitus squalens TaxID=114155 RepID=A0A4Q9MJI1_9APHY|nr:hypothetical protein BD311DRAFT_763359 [Dichomitus squalens]
MFIATDSWGFESGYRITYVRERKFYARTVRTGINIDKGRKHARMSSMIGRIMLYQYIRQRGATRDVYDMCNGEESERWRASMIVERDQVAKSDGITVTTWVANNNTQGADKPGKQTRDFLQRKPTDPKRASFVAQSGRGMQGEPRRQTRLR